MEGHTDNIHAKAFNQKLSEQRANAVVAWLTQDRFEPSRQTAQGFGDTKSVAGNTAGEGRAKNRRVEFIKM